MKKLLWIILIFLSSIFSFVFSQSGQESTTPVLSGNNSSLNNSSGTSSQNNSGQSVDTTGQSNNSNLSGQLLNGSGTTNNNFSLPQSSENTFPFSSGSVYISEIFAKDTAFLGEYIVIESLIDYSGAVEVVGLGQGTASKIFTISIHSGQHLYVTDTPSKISNPQAIIIPQSSITLTDGGEQLQIKLTGGTVTDDLIYQGTSTDQAFFYTSTQTNGQRLFTNFLQPTALFTSTLSSGSGQVNSGTVLSTGTQIDTGANQSGTGNSTGTGGLTGDILTGSIIPPTTGLVCIDLFINPISVKITEIHPYDTELFPEYIELLVEGIIYSPLTIQGIGQGQASKTILLSGQQGRVIITDDKSFFPQTTKVFELSSISLTDSGEPLQIIGQSGQVLDSTVYVTGIPGKSLYFSGDTQQNTFSYTDLPSPGFDLSQVNYLLFDKNLTNFYSCSINLQHTEPFFAGRKINLIASSDNKELQNNNNDYSCERQFQDTDYEFTGCNPSFYEYTTGGIYTVGVSIKNLTTLQTCQTTLSINYPINPSDGQVCKQTYYQDLYLKRKGRFEYIKKGIGAFGLTANASGDVSEKGTSTGQQLSIWTGKVQILSILPNPAGKDDNRESITLKNTDSVSYDLTQFVLFNGKSKKKFPPETPPLLPNQERTITTTLGLTNGPVCIKLQDKTTIYMTFCYPKAADDQVFTQSMDSLQAVFTQDPKLLNQITVALESTQACALFNKEQVICKALKFTDNIVKEYKKQAKKTESVEKKLIKEQTKSASYKTKYDDQKKKRAQDKTTFSLKIKAQKLAEGLIRDQKQLLQGYTNLILDELQTNRYTVYKNSKLPGIYALYKTLLDTLKDNTSTHFWGGVGLPAQEIQTIYSLSQQGSVPLQETSLDQLYTNVITNTKQAVDDLLKNLTIETQIEPP